MDRNLPSASHDHTASPSLYPIIMLGRFAPSHLPHPSIQYSGASRPRPSPSLRPILRPRATTRQGRLAGLALRGHARLKMPETTPARTHRRACAQRPAHRPTPHRHHPTPHHRAPAAPAPPLRRLIFPPPRVSGTGIAGRAVWAGVRLRTGASGAPRATFHGTNVTLGARIDHRWVSQALPEPAFCLRRPG